MARVVVGVDGSPSGQGALRWALDHVNPDDEVVVVHTWQIYPAVGIEGMAYADVDLEEACRQTLDRVIEAEIGDGGDGPTIIPKALRGHPGVVLIDESHSADMLVVGTRGLGGFKGLMLGSVSTYCVHHARCPIVVVPVAGERT